MKLAFVLTLTLAATGCASADQQDTTPVEMRGADQAKMQAIEQAAERTGARVYWVNPPVTPSSSTSK